MRFRIGVVTILRIWIRHGVVFERLYRRYVFFFFLPGGGGDGVRSFTSSAGGLVCVLSLSLRLVVMCAWSCLEIVSLLVPRGIPPLVLVSVSLPTGCPRNRSGYRGCFCNLTEHSVHYAIPTPRPRMPLSLRRLQQAFAVSILPLAN